MCFFELESVGDFVEYLPSCYSQKPSITDLIIVNVGLARIFYCCSFYEPDAHLRAEYESQSTACYRNIDLVMPQLPFAAAHTFDLALALCMAVRPTPLPRGTNMNHSDSFLVVALHGNCKTTHGLEACRALDARVPVTGVQSRRHRELVSRSTAETAIHNVLRHGEDAGILPWEGIRNPQQ